MSSIHLQLPDDVLSRLRDRATESGYDSVEAFAQALLHQQTESPYMDEDVEALLIERIDDSRPSVEATPEFWARLHAKIEAQVRDRSAKP